ncbi:variant surface glycoprotein (VSG), putative [Trypanosoma equiperdum]|uniref:Variant surface glycoprotein (VSG), putative n=1 Tax=Trypanosoma equiperdum TaxID=5694 RepID=A0A1G4IJB2_TRYEQ|nr:variant surface glycoprotein (VSG), putative [Trypanosoma equiperdum]
MMALVELFVIATLSALHTNVYYRTAAAATPEAHETSITSRCNEAKYVTAITRLAEAKVRLSTAGLQDLETTGRRWAAAAGAAAESPDRALGYHIMAAYARSQAQRQRGIPENLRKQADKTLKILHQRLGMTMALLSKRTITKGKAAFVSSPGGDTEKACKFSPTQTATTEANCPMDDVSENGVGDTKFNFDAATTIKLLYLTTTAPLLPDFQCEGKGDASSVAQVIANRCVDGASSNQIIDLTIRAGATDEGLTGKPAQLYTTTDAVGKCRSAEAQEDFKPDNNDHVANSICHLLTAANADTTAITDLDPQQLKDKQPFISLYTAYLYGTGELSSKEAASPSEAVKNKLQATLGGGKAGWKNKFMTYLTDTKITPDPNQPNKEVSLEDLAKGPNTDQALLYLLGKNAAQAKHAESTCKLQVTETEDSCNKKGQTECNSLCKWHAEAEGKKCKLSEEVKKIAEKTAENDDKTTNTTGRISFVVNKAHLLLAFFH